MKIEDAVAAMRRDAAPWDDLVERRVLNDIHAAHARGSVRRRRLRSIAPIAAALVLMASAAAVMWTPREEPLSVAAMFDVPRVAIETPAEAAQGSVLSLSDGSRVVLDDGSHVDTETQTAGLVRLAHREGRVRYDVTPDPSRAFVVDAGVYQIRVVGTAFTVEMTTDHVRVEVERGAVEIVHADAGRTIPLVAGESIELPREVSAPPDEPMPAASTAPTATPTVRRLLERADTARRSGRPRDAAQALRTLVGAHPKDPRTPSAWFMLGRVERQLGQHARAALAFRSAHRLRSSGALAEDARAEEALSWHDAGSTDRARAAARDYLARYPKGTHAMRLRPLARDR
jgi:hypothetical protein